MSGLFAVQDEDFSVPGLDCGDCHGSGGWERLTLKGFNHNDTSFPLEGIHQIQTCTDCHSGSTIIEKHMFNQSDATCTSCHIDVHKGELGNDCTKCHSVQSWTVNKQSFNHNTTQFPLTNGHNSVDCIQCHESLSPSSFTLTPTDCYSCHLDAYEATGTHEYPTSPNHTSLDYDQNCSVCHSTINWTDVYFNHDDTDYPLTDAHETTPCLSCHSNGQYTLPLTCDGCHIEGGVASSNSSSSTFDHESTQVNSNCESCHSAITWDQILFNHDDTNFPLTGLHETAECQSCHETNIDNLSLACDGCHIEDGIAETNSLLSSYDHISHNINSECQLCHTTNDWIQTIFDHVNFSVLNCVECHLIEHTNSEEPPHSNDNISSSCIECHSTTDWTISPFDHTLAQTGYILEGAHIEIECADCHIENVFASTPQDCWGCHIDEYNATGTPEYPDSPDHTAFEYSQDCNLCHSQDTWEGAEFDHNETEFPLTGLHLDAECETCHTNNTYDLPLTCDGCHIETGMAETNSTTSEYDHVSHQIDAMCEQCHTTEGWDQLIFDHVNFLIMDCKDCHLIDHTNSENPPHGNDNVSDQCELCHESDESWLISTFLHTVEQTEYELTGIHITTDCDLCHINQVYNSTPNTCENEACHLDEFNETTDPNHGDYAFPPTYCTHCHSTLGWEPDIYEHDIEDPCVSCHLPDYNNANAHVDNLFPTNCEACHTSTEDWENTSFDHDTQFFPIYSGEHEGEWTTCIAECHIEPEDYSIFSCGLNGVCHEHDQDEMDDEHDDEDDYVYESTACYDCHPNGEEDDDLRSLPVQRKRDFMKKFPEHFPQ